MAWRIESHLVRGEIDNRIRGRIVGRLWFLGREEPIEIDLQGNAWRDLAGRQLAFVNPKPEPGLPHSFTTRQVGVAGDFTASLKRRIPDVSDEEFRQHYVSRTPFPWHWGNCVYLEWFSTTNGRVVIESPEYQLTVSGDAEWEMTEKEEAAQQQLNAQAMEQFLRKFDSAIPLQNEAVEEVWKDSDDDEGWKNGGLPGEECDEENTDVERLVDGLMAPFEDVGDLQNETLGEDEFDAQAFDSTESSIEPASGAEDDAWSSNIDLDAEESSAASDQDLLDGGHVLSDRSAELVEKLLALQDELAWTANDAVSRPPALVLLDCVMNAAARLAGVLEGREWPPAVEECAHCVSWLKRALASLEEALLAAGKCQGLRALPAEPLWAATEELKDLHREVQTLIRDLEDRIERGSE